MLSVSVLVFLLAVNAQAAPSTFGWDGRQLVEVRAQIGRGELSKSLASLKTRADKALNGLYSVMDKNSTPPSGSKHDYMSQAPYWWPPGIGCPASDACKNITKTCVQDYGKPFERHDGYHNPCVDSLDDHRSGDMATDVTWLSVYSWLTNHSDPAYSNHAAKMLRRWFLDPDWLMNPNLKYGQGVPGQDEGRQEGMIEVSSWAEMLDGVVLLRTSPAWSQADDDGLRAWMAKFFDWALTNSIGQKEFAATNNHGTWMDNTMSAMALFLGNKTEAAKIAKAAPSKRVDVQVMPNGTLPQELARTKSASYATMDATAFMSLAHLAQHSGVDLYGYCSASKQCLRKVIEYLLPYAINDTSVTHPCITDPSSTVPCWPYPQITSFSWGDLFQPLRRAAIAFNSSTYEKGCQKLPDVDYGGNFLNLVLPPFKP